MRIGIHASTPDTAQVVQLCREVGVRDVILSAREFSAEDPRGDIERAVASLGNQGISVGAMIAPNPSREAVLGQAEEEVASLCARLRAIGEAGIQVALFYPVDRFRNYLAEYHHTKPPLGDAGDQAGADHRLFRRVCDVAGPPTCAWPATSLQWRSCSASSARRAAPAGHHLLRACTSSATILLASSFGIERIFSAMPVTCVTGRAARAMRGPGRWDIDMGRYLHCLADAVTKPVDRGASRRRRQPKDAVAYLKRCWPPSEVAPVSLLRAAELRDHAAIHNEICPDIVGISEPGTPPPRRFSGSPACAPGRLARRPGVAGRIGRH